MKRERGERDELLDLVRHAQCALAGLQFSCKTLLLRVGQVEVRAPEFNGLVSPMGEEAREILEGIVKAQAAHGEMELVIERMD